MFESFFEWLAAKTNPRFKLFVEAKQSYLSFISDSPVRFDQMSEQDYFRALQDQRLSAAESGFRTAIDLSEGEGALDDATVAKYQLGLVYHVMGKLEESKALMNASLEVASGLLNGKRGDHTSACHYHLGIIAMKQSNTLEAIRHLTRSRDIDQVNADFAGVQLCDLALGRCAKGGGEKDTEG